MALPKNLLPKHTQKFSIETLLEHMRMNKDLFRNQVTVRGSSFCIDGEICDLQNGFLVVKSFETKVDVKSNQSIFSYSVIPLNQIHCINFYSLET